MQAIKKLVTKTMRKSGHSSRDTLNQAKDWDWLLQEHSLSGLRGHVTVVAFDATQQLLAVGTMRGQILVMNGQASAYLPTESDKPIKLLHFIQNDGLLVAVDAQSRVTGWNMSKLTADYVLEDVGASITTFANSVGSTWLYFGAVDGRVLVYDGLRGLAAKRHVPCCCAEPQVVTALAAHPQQPQMLLVAYAVGKVVLYDLLNNQVARTYTLESHATHLQFQWDGKWFAVALEGGKLQLIHAKQEKSTVAVGVVAGGQVKSLQLVENAEQRIILVLGDKDVYAYIIVHEKVQSCSLLEMESPLVEIVHVVILPQLVWRADAAAQILTVRRDGIFLVSSLKVEANAVKTDEFHNPYKCLDSANAGAVKAHCMVCVDGQKYLVTAHDFGSLKFFLLGATNVITAARSFCFDVSLPSTGDAQISKVVSCGESRLAVALNVALIQMFAYAAETSWTKVLEVTAHTTSVNVLLQQNGLLIAGDCTGVVSVTDCDAKQQLYVGCPLDSKSAMTWATLLAADDGTRYIMMVFDDCSFAKFQYVSASAMYAVTAVVKVGGTVPTYLYSIQAQERIHIVAISMAALTVYEDQKFDQTAKHSQLDSTIVTAGLVGGSALVTVQENGIVTAWSLPSLTKTELGTLSPIDMKLTVKFDFVSQIIVLSDDASGYFKLISVLDSQRPVKEMPQLFDASLQLPPRPQETKSANILDSVKAALTVSSVLDDQAWRQQCEQLDKACAPQVPPKDNVQAGERKQLLGDINNEAQPGKLQADGGDAQNAFMNAKNALDERGEKLEALNSKFANLSNESSDFLQRARELNRQQQDKKWYDFT